MAVTEAIAGSGMVRCRYKGQASWKRSSWLWSLLSRSPPAWPWPRSSRRPCH